MPAEESNTTVSFRLPQDRHDEIVRLAAEAGITKHQLARTLVVRALDSGEGGDPIVDLSAFEEAFKSVFGEFRDLRIALGRSVAAILQDVAPSRDKEEIRKWVFARIISKTDGKGGERP